MLVGGVEEVPTGPGLKRAWNHFKVARKLADAHLLKKKTQNFS